LILEIKLTVIKENLKIFPEAPTVKRAELGTLNGLWGALAQARNL
jgi:hypothetical protein